MLRLHSRPTKQAPWEKPSRPWNGPCSSQAFSTNRRLWSKPNAGPFLFVPLNVPSSLLNHQLRSLSSPPLAFSATAFVFFELFSSLSPSVLSLFGDDSSELVDLIVSGAVTNTNSAYLLRPLRNAPTRELENLASLVSMFERRIVGIEMLTT